MEPVVKKYPKNDPQQYEDEKEYWQKKSAEFKIECVEQLRENWLKMQGGKNENISGLRRVYKIIKQK